MPIVLAGATTLVTLADVRAQLNVPAADTSNDTELLGFINAATNVVEDITGLILPRTVTNEVYNGGTSRIALRHGPVISIQSVIEYVGNTSFTLTSQPQGSTTNYYGYDLIDANAGILVRRDASGSTMNFQGGELGVTVSYTAGYSSVPDSVRLGTLMLIQHWWDNTQQGFGANGGAFSPDEGSTTMPAYSVPNYVAQLLGALPSAKSKIPGIA